MINTIKNMKNPTIAIVIIISTSVLINVAFDDDCVNVGKKNI